MRQRSEPICVMGSASEWIEKHPPAQITLLFVGNFQAPMSATGRTRKNKMYKTWCYCCCCTVFHFGQCSFPHFPRASDVFFLSLAACLLYLQLQKQADKSEQEDANEHISLAVVSNWKYEHSIPRSIALPHRFIMSLRVGAFRFGLKINITTCASTSASVWLRAKKRARRKCGRLFQRGRKGRWRVSRQQRPDLVPWGKPCCISFTPPGLVVVVVCWWEAFSSLLLPARSCTSTSAAIVNAMVAKGLPLNMVFHSNGGDDVADTSWPDHPTARSGPGAVGHVGSFRLFSFFVVVPWPGSRHGMPFLRTVRRKNQTVRAHLHNQPLTRRHLMWLCADEKTPAGWQCKKNCSNGRANNQWEILYS